MIPMQQELVTKNFPILYGIKTPPLEQPQENITTITSDVSGHEYGLKGGVKAEQIQKVMVPDEHVDYTRALFAHNPETIHIKVLPNSCVEANH